MGSDNSASDAQRAAELAERERQMAMSRATGRVNAVFDAPARAAQLQEFINALRQNYRIDADRQKGIADRQLKFSMARSGLTGGSASADANRLLGQEYTRGLMDAESRAQEGQGELRAADEASRMNILSMIRQGLDATTAAQRAGSAIQANAQIAKGSALTEGLGDIFGGTAQIYKQQREAAERRRGERAMMESIYGRGSFGAT